MSSLQSATLYTSRPVEVVSETGTARTLGDVLRDLLPTLYTAPAPAQKEEQAASSSTDVKTAAVPALDGQAHPQVPYSGRCALI